MKNENIAYENIEKKMDNLSFSELVLEFVKRY
jgi:hypothetical protein